MSSFPDPFGPVEAATASSRAATLPMFVAADHSGPAGRHSLIGPIGYDDEVIVRRQRAALRSGLVMVTSVPPTRIQTPQPLCDCPAEGHRKPDDLADIFQGVVIEVDELLCAEVESRLTGPKRARAD